MTDSAAAERRPMVARGETPGQGEANEVAPSGRPSMGHAYQGFRKASTPGYHRSPLRG